MANKKITMLQIRRLIQLKSLGLSNREIARELSISRDSANNYVKRLDKSGLDTDSLLALTDEVLSQIAYKEPDSILLDGRYKDFHERISYFLEELTKPKVTRQILWEEYRKDYPDGYSYSQFCEYLCRFTQSSKAVMHFDHKPGDFLFFDFAGDYLSYVDTSTGELIRCPVLICVLPFSGYTYVEALRNQTREELIEGLNNALSYFGGVPACVKSDNLGQWVKKANRYEPEFTVFAGQWSLHYNTTLMTARVAKPRDKASVESHVNVVYNRIYAALHNKEAHNLSELNAMVMEYLQNLNKRKMQQHDYSRQERFLQHEKHLLKPVPAHLFVPKSIVTAKVQKSYHVMLGEDKHYYSVPYRYLGSTVQVVYDTRHIEILLPNNHRIASHTRDYRKYQYTTLKEHMPVKHQRYSDSQAWNDVYFMEEAEKIGHSTAIAIGEILKQRIFIEQTYNACIGVIRMANKYTRERLEKACERAIKGPKVTYTIIKNILNNNMDKVTVPENLLFTIPEHDNIRGQELYQ